MTARIPVHKRTRSHIFPASSVIAAGLEPDASVAHSDKQGLALLRHARVYTSAELLGFPQLCSQALSTIHCTSSTVHGEIEYARYLYHNRGKDETAVSRPIAVF